MPTNASYQAALALPIVLYHLVTTGKKPVFAGLPWNRWATLSVDIILLILQIAAVAASNYDCQGICHACTPAGRDIYDGADFNVFYGSMFCTCTFNPAEEYKKREVLARLIGERAVSRATSGAMNKYTEKTFSIAVKRGLGAVMM